MQYGPESTRVRSRTVIPLRGLVILWTILAFRPAMTPAAAPTSAPRIPAGDFLMGASDAEADERPVHRVTVSEFFIGRFPVTNDEYARFVRADRPSGARRSASCRSIAAGGRDASSRISPRLTCGRTAIRPPGHGNHPVVLVRYDDAVAYCAWLVGRDRPRPSGCRPRPSGKRPRAAASKAQRYPWGDDIDPSRCNYLADPPAKRQRGTRPTGTYPPNAFGLCDMIGNVWEWVSDWYDAEYYGSGEHAGSARARRRQPAHRSRRLVGERRHRDAAVRLSPQGAARHVRVQHRFSHRVQRLTDRAVHRTT